MVHTANIVHNNKNQLNFIQKVNNPIPIQISNNQIAFRPQSIQKVDVKSVVNF